MTTDTNIRKTIHEFLISNVFGGRDDGRLTDDTPLISSRLMDSIVALKMVSFLEEKFGIEFEANEVDQDNLDSISIIAKFIESKLK